MQSSQPMKTFVVDLLKEKLPTFYYYHNYEHTLYVREKAIEIGRQENCTEKEIALLETAGLWHDTGLIHINHGHEKKSCLLARQYLPSYGFSAADIEIVCGMIMATRLPQSPKDKLGEILADADLEYLGTNAAAEWAGKLYREQKHFNPSLTDAQWHQAQISFLEVHHYFTQFCRQHKAPGEKAYLNSLINDIGSH